MTRKQFRNVILIIMVIALIVAAADLAYLETTDKRFIRYAERGMLAGWDKSEPESTLRDRSLENDTAFIDIEYEAVSRFKDKEFRDESLGEVAGEYIDAVIDCHEVTSEKDPNKKVNSFWKSFSEPYGRRIKAFCKLMNGDFGFLRKMDDAYRQDVDELLLQGWALNKTNEIVFNHGGEDENELTAEVVNDSGHDLEYLDMTVDLYDGKDNYLETVSVYQADIKKNDKFTLRCYEVEAGRTKQFVITAITCEKAD